MHVEIDLHIYSAIRLQIINRQTVQERLLPITTLMQWLTFAIHPENPAAL